MHPWGKLVEFGPLLTEQICNNFNSMILPIRAQQSVPLPGNFILEHYCRKPRPPIRRMEKVVVMNIIGDHLNSKLWFGGLKGKYVSYIMIELIGLGENQFKFNYTFIPGSAFKCTLLLNYNLEK